MAKKRLLSAVNPSAILHASPTKQFSSFALLVMDEPSYITEFSHITPAPIVTLASGMLFSVQSFSLSAPSMVHPSLMWQLLTSVVLQIRTSLPMVVMCELWLEISFRIIVLMTSVKHLSASYFTIRAASWELSPSNIITLPLPTSLRTDITLPSPKLASGVVFIRPTLFIRQSLPTDTFLSVALRMPEWRVKPLATSTSLRKCPRRMSPKNSTLYI